MLPALTVLRLYAHGFVLFKFQVRGAPAIAILGCLSLAVELHDKSFDSSQSICEFVEEQMNYLVTARPTAVNLSKAATTIIKMTKQLLQDNCTANFIKIK